jgi:hypothetical protein
MCVGEHEHPAASAPTGHAGHDGVARSRQAEAEARRLLASGGVDAALAEEIRVALVQLRADRANGESPIEASARLATLIDRHDPRRGRPAPD